MVTLALDNKAESAMMESISMLHGKNAQMIDNMFSKNVR